VEEIIKILISIDIASSKEGFMSTKEDEYEPDLLTLLLLFSKGSRKFQSLYSPFYNVNQAVVVFLRSFGYNYRIFL